MNFTPCGSLEHGSVICVLPEAPPCCFGSSNSHDIRYVTYIIYVTLAACGSLLNLLTLTALPYARRTCTDKRSPLKSSLTLLIIHLAFWDFMYCFIFLPMMALQIRNRGWKYGPTSCYIFSIVRHFPVYLSFFSITSVALNRCITVWYPRVGRLIFQSRKTIPVILFMWTIVIILLVPTLFPSLRIGRYGYNYYAVFCDAVPSDNGRFNYHYIGIVLMHYANLLITITCGILIFIKVKKASRRFKNMRDIAPNTLLHFQRRERSISLLVVSITAFFTVCITPCSVYYLLFNKPERRFSIGVTIMCMIYQLNFIGNFFIYVLGSECYRGAFAKFLKRIVTLVFGHVKYMENRVIVQLNK